MASEAERQLPEQQARVWGRVTDAFRAWSERRQTAARAGAVSQQFAARRLDRFVRANARALVVVSLFVLTPAVGLYLLGPGEPTFRALVAGIIAGAGLTFGYHWCVIASGASASSMGQAAEQWTDAELRRLHRRGWKHVNRLVIKGPGDIDHVAVGPDGVLVIETKWRGGDVVIDSENEWTRSALAQARRNRDEVRRLLNWRERDGRPIEALVVWWGPEVKQSSKVAERIGDVNVIAGEHLRAELVALSDRRLIADEVDEVHRQLVQRIETRDGWEASQVAPEMPTLADHARRLLEGIAAAGTGFFAAVFSFRLGWWSLAAIAAAVVLTLWVRRAPLWRSRANWFLVGIAGVVPVFVALLALAS
jgi:hypothetical protein